MSVVTIDYTNWRGERRIREIVPLGNVRKADLDHAYHPGKWVFDAMCADTGEVRHFALEGIHSWQENTST